MIIDDLYDDIYQTLDEVNQHIPHNSLPPHGDPPPPPPSPPPFPPPPSPPPVVHIDEQQNLRDSIAHDINQLQEKIHNI